MAPTPGMTLAQLCPMYLDYRRAVEGRKANTVRGDETAVRLLIQVAGDIQPRSLNQRHADAYVRAISGRSVSLFNTRLAAVKSFERWLRRERLVARDFEVFDFRSRKDSRPDRHRVPVDRFGELLDRAGERHPRDRMLVACGLFLFLRASEIRLLQLSDVDLEAGEVHVYVKKTDEYDIMPVSSELDAELRRWLSYYESQHPGLDPSWCLVPARNPGATRWADGKFLRGGPPTALRPSHRMCATGLSEPVQRALADIGWPTMREGVHTLRRSGARAYFDSLVDQGYDGALKRVSAMLHHASVTMTERYLGIREDRHSRNVAIRGQAMFPKSRGDATLAVLQTA